MSSSPEAEALLRLYPRLIESLECGSGGPFVAAILVGDEIVGSGTNTVLRDRDVTRHAEMNALGDAGRRAGRIHLEGARLVTSHFPCLMCYHAAKWAAVREVHYIFDYAETEGIFGFRGDARFLEDLGVGSAGLSGDASLLTLRIDDPRIDALYRTELPRLWDSAYRARCGVYDI